MPTRGMVGGREPHHNRIFHRIEKAKWKRKCDVLEPHPRLRPFLKEDEQDDAEVPAASLGQHPSSLDAELTSLDPLQQLKWRHFGRWSVSQS